MIFKKPNGVEHGGLILGDTEIRGEITFKDLINIEGRVEGKIFSEAGRLVIAEKGRIDGNIEVGSASISGAVHGDVFARERIDIHSTGKIEGDICAPILTVDAGANITGRVETVAPNAGMRLAAKNPINPSSPKAVEKEDVRGLKAG